MRRNKKILYETSRGLMLAAVSLCVSVLLGCGKTEYIEVPPTPNTAPTISLKGDASVSVPLGGTYTELGATATDPEDGDISSGIKISGEVNTQVSGQYVLVYTVTDSGGKSAFVTRTVTVGAGEGEPDTTPPVITLVGDATVYVKVGGVYQDAGATATDNVDEAITLKVTVNAMMDLSKEGDYQVTYTVSDAAGNAAIPVVRHVIVYENDATINAGADDWDDGADPNPITVRP